MYFILLSTKYNCECIHYFLYIGLKGPKGQVGRQGLQGKYGPRGFAGNA